MTTKSAGYMALGLLLATGSPSLALAADDKGASEEADEALSVITGTFE